MKFLLLLLMAQLGPGQRSYYIPGDNMLPTLQPGDYVIAVPVRAPRISDTIVFRPPAKNYLGHADLIISRIVAMGGDVVEIRQNHLWRNGKQIQESFVKSPMKTPFAPIRVRPGEFFVLGDNRDNSYDSRFWGGVPRQNVLYKVTEVYWSKDWSRFGKPVK